MKDWDSFAKTTQETVEVSGTKPSVYAYILIKATDSSLVIAIFILTLLFAYTGLFQFDKEQTEQINWALHASELCLGVFLGLLKPGKEK
jgi:hypothetical protein